MKMCRSCSGPVCPRCGGCVLEGECSCIYYAIQEGLEPLRAIIVELIDALQYDRPAGKWGQTLFDNERALLIAKARKALEGDQTDE